MLFCSESGACRHPWNPVKELKGVDLVTRADVRADAWNPVKELKVPIVVKPDIAHRIPVESGEGIES